MIDEQEYAHLMDKYNAEFDSTNFSKVLRALLAFGLKELHENRKLTETPNYEIIAAEFLDSLYGTCILSSTSEWISNPSTILFGSIYAIKREGGIDVQRSMEMAQTFTINVAGYVMECISENRGLTHVKDILKEIFSEDIVSIISDGYSTGLKNFQSYTLCSYEKFPDFLKKMIGYSLEETKMKDNGSSEI